MWPNASSWLALKLLLRGACLVQLVVDAQQLRHLGHLEADRVLAQAPQG
jgi:hypothetical protein